MNAVDTNVLLYARDPRYPEKQATALRLVETLVDGVLLWQVACEYLAASRKLEPLGCSLDSAYRDIVEFRTSWSLLLPKRGVLDRAIGLMSRFSLSWWDAILVGACLEGDVRRLYTEDFGAYSHIDTLEIVNPFER